MIDQEVEELLWAEYERITRGQQVQSLGELPALVDENRPEVTIPAPRPAAKTEPESQKQETAGGSSVGSKIGNAALDFGKNRLNAMPLISTLVNLFTGGGDPAPPPPLMKYAMPPSIHIAAANSRDGSGIQALDYGQDGMARVFSETAAASLARPGNAAAPQIVVNVQAMDSRSFLDHSQEIAQAVREAMLNMHALNDVVSEL